MWNISPLLKVLKCRAHDADDAGDGDDGEPKNGHIIFLKIPSERTQDGKKNGHKTAAATKNIV